MLSELACFIWWPFLCTVLRHVLRTALLYGQQAPVAAWPIRFWIASLVAPVK